MAYKKKKKKSSFLAYIPFFKYFFITFLFISFNSKLFPFTQAGHVCGDAHDLVEGLPTGSVRISFGYMSSYRDADQLLQMVKECFVEGSLITDSSWIEVQPCLAEKENCHMRGQIELGKKELVNGNEKHFDGSERTVRTKNGYLDSDITNSPLQVQNERNMTSAPPLKLTNIILYPVKSCSGISVREWSIGGEGLKYDRQWMIVTNSGATLTQKRLPIMSLIKPSIDLVNGLLKLSFKGMWILFIPCRFWLR